MRAPTLRATRPFVAVSRRRRTRLLGPSWPVAGATAGAPLWWAFGLGPFAWIAAALPLALQLRQRNRLVAPRGFGIWLLFLGWVAVSGLQLEAASQAMGFAYRLLIYASSGVLLLYAYNAPRHVLPDRLFLDLAATLWFSLVAFGLVALVVPDLAFRTPAERLLPAALSSHPFVHALVHADLAQTHVFLGFPVPRPSAPFTYTNEWGSMYALLAPLVWCWFIHEPPGDRRRIAAVLAMASVVPVVVSLNRGLWLSLAVAVVYTAAQLTRRRQARLARRLVVGVVLCASVLAVTPLGTLALDRLETGHSDSGRISLITQSTDSALDAPVLGHGSTRDQSDGTGPDVGTHGQLWLVAVSHGLPGTALFLGFLLMVFLRSGRRSLPSVAFWAHVTVMLAVVQLPFYALLPAQLPMVFLSAGVALRTERDVPVPPSVRRLVP